MGKCSFVVPEVVRLELSGGEWIEVKRELTYGEQKRLAAAGVRYKERSEDGVILDLERGAIARLETWIVDWSFTDPSDKRVAVSHDAIATMTVERGAEIDAALTKHIRGIEDQKNVTTPATTGRKQK